jgi:RHS repeat-associated protein
VNGPQPPQPPTQPGCNTCDGDHGQGGAGSAADPIDLRTGVFAHNWVDLAVDDIMPISLKRTYRPGDTVSRPFGYGMNHDYGMYLYTQSATIDSIQLILPDGERITFNRTSGTGPAGTWAHTTSRTRYYGAILTVGSTWSITLKDGSQYRFITGTAINTLSAIIDRYGNAVSLTYVNNQLTQVRSPSGRYIQFTYDTAGRATLARDHTGRSVSYLYNSLGMLDTVAYPDGTTEHYSYDSARRMLSMTDRRGNTEFSNQYDAQSRVVAQTYADGAVYQLAYTTDANGVITQADVTDPRGTVRRVVFDPVSGYPTTDTLGYGTPLAQTYRFERNAAGLITVKIDPLGRRTEYTFDANGNITAVTQLAGTPNTVTYRYSYTPDYNQIASITDPLGHATQFTYTNGCLTSVKDALNRTTSFICNSSGQRTAITDALGRTTRFGYDGYDLYSITDPLNHSTTLYRDALGRVISVQNPLGNRTLSSYDVMDRITQTRDPLGAPTQYHYDANGNLTSLLDPLANAITYAYDSRDRVQSRTDALHYIERWTYDPLGLVLTSTDRKGQLTRLSYDTLGRQINTTYADNSSVSIQYDAGNRAAQISDTTSGTIFRSYDGRDQLTQETTPQGSVSYGYDAASRRVQMQASGSAPVNYSYDAADRLTNLSQGSETVGFVYDAVDRRVKLTLPNGIKTNYSYDLADQLTSLSYSTSGGSLIGDLQYGYDAAGRRTHIGGSFAPQSLPSATTSDYQHNASNQLVGGNGIAPQYDANGDPTGDGQISQYVFDVRRRLVQIRQGVVITASFQYDALNRRIAKTDANGITTSYQYDGLDPVQENNGGTARSILTGQNIDERFGRDDTTGRTYFLTDHLGSTLALTDTSGNIVQRYNYEPYGAVQAAGAAGLSNPYQYTGRENDGNGLYYYRARYYNPATKRFISEDPLQEAAGPNSYGYVDGSPLSFRDPRGLSALGDVGAFLGGWGGRVAGVAGGEFVFPLGGGVVGGVLGGRAGAWGGRAAGELLNTFLNANSNPLTGDPGSEQTCGNKRGNRKQTRRYGSDGFPETDTDWDHSHDGLGSPHSHDWGAPQMVVHRRTKTEVLGVLRSLGIRGSLN